MVTTVRFTKMHGAGNDYLFADGQHPADWPAVARAACDRHFGIGADGIILALPSTTADLRMRMFNADGSEAEMCGNGIRCLVRYALERGLVRLPNGRAVQVETLGGARTVEPIFAGETMIAARVGMGRPVLRPSRVPVNVAMLVGPRSEGPLLDWPLSVGGRTIPITAVSMGNPHAVAFLDEPVGEFPLEQLGPLIEHHPFFPKRVNLEIVNTSGKGHLVARVWERGSGLTLACGTGACAMAVAARLHGLIKDDVDITLPGGTLRVHWDGQGEVMLEGPVAELFEVEWPVAPASNHGK